ncbi:MAG: type IV pili twitching motility protein PilT [Deltaproteobacteria bacterium CG11_big_fil_rev_8_21_14_0_20_45_16]|nr:MAG: type IV pili twitching motility protein PilT [Deltaproteobacteria bacterium CG11_big_fil_rev_8_21_14_0_20_45_16]
MELNDILKIAVKANASDIHIKAGLVPTFRIDGSLVPLNNAPKISPEQVSAMTQSMMNAQQKLRFQEFNEVDLAYGVPGLGRFRVNVFQQRGTTGVVLRVIPYLVKSVEELLLPPTLRKLSMNERGLILVTGATGSGKSTTLAAMVDNINENRACHIVTIEEPIEYLIKDKKSIVNQREVGVDTVGFHFALRAALRQDPDVILVGEMRDAETMETALSAAETGHLVFSTLHTMDAAETINRIVSVFPPYQHKQIRLQLASVIKAIISQRLVPKKSGEGRVPAMEVLINNARIKEMIENPDHTREITQAIADSHTSYEMQTFDQSLMQLLTKDLISYEEALRQSSNPHDFALRFSGISSGNNSNWDAFEELQSQAEQESAADKPPTKKAK